jgi:hypothetical protein
MPACRRPPLTVERLEVRAVVGDEHSTLLGRVAKLLLVRYPAVTPPDLVNGDGIDAARAQALRHPLAHVLVEEEAQAHPAWLSAIRASISSGYAS